jgi:urease beta subunit
MYFARRFGAMAALCAALAAPCADAADQPATVDRAISIVRAGLATKRDDKQTAKALAKLTLVGRLDPVVVEQMESEGAGPFTLEELGRLADATAYLEPPASPPVFPHAPIPSRDEMAAAIHHARVYALSYEANLPNFLCNENIVRYEDLRGKGAWEKRDILGLRLSFEDREEKDKLVTLNGRPTTWPLSAVAGARTSGEFGALMLQILDPGSRGKFHWDHWTLLRKRPTQVYAYRIDAADSHYKLVFGTAYQHEETVAAMEGTLYLDGESLDIVRIANHAADIELSFPVRQAATTLDYAAQDVGGKRYVLPLHAEIRLSTGQIRTRNMVEFAGYRKFEGESTITFDDTEPPPPVKIKH